MLDNGLSATGQASHMLCATIDGDVGDLLVALPIGDDFAIFLGQPAQFGSGIHSVLEILAAILGTDKMMENLLTSM